MNKIVTDVVELGRLTKEVDSFDEAKEIADKLFKILSEHSDGVGLAANQIGINKKVCVVHVPHRKPLWFMNPRFKGGFEFIEFDEGCLSFPDQIVTTRRYKSIIVDADNLEKEMMFTAEDDPLECVCIQHEIDHLNGKTMFGSKAELFK